MYSNFYNKIEKIFFAIFTGRIVIVFYFEIGADFRSYKAGSGKSGRAAKFAKVTVFNWHNVTL